MTLDQELVSIIKYYKHNCKTTDLKSRIRIDNHTLQILRRLQIELKNAVGEYCTMEDVISYLINEHNKTHGLTRVSKFFNYRDLLL
jgi:hypothetical protein